MIFREDPCAVLFGRLGEQLETVRKKTGAERVPVFARAADTRARLKRTMLAQRKSALAGIVTKSNGFLREILHHAKADGVVEFVHSIGVVGCLTRNASFQDDNGESRTRT